VFDRLLGRLIEECESFGWATTMVIPSGLALDVQGAAFREKLSILAWPLAIRGLQNSAGGAAFWLGRPLAPTTATCVRFVTPNLRMICRT
jgi:hypothetical protein